VGVGCVRVDSADLAALLAQSAALRTRTIPAELGEPESGLGAVGPAQRESLGPIELDLGRRFRLGQVHRHPASVARGRARD
jgi:hypothetical protein